MYWTDYPGTYILGRADDGYPFTSPYHDVYTGIDTSFTDSVLVSGIIYRYRIRAYSDISYSEWTAGDSLQVQIHYRGDKMIHRTVYEDNGGKRYWELVQIGPGTAQKFQKYGWYMCGGCL